MAYKAGAKAAGPKAAAKGAGWMTLGVLIFELLKAIAELAAKH